MLAEPPFLTLSSRSESEAQIRGKSSACAAAVGRGWTRWSYRRCMRTATVERLLAEMALDQVLPQRYSRKSLPWRSLPLAQVTVSAVSVVVLGIVLGRL
jgi:hypothetical protein